MSQLPFACRLFTLPIKSAFLYDRRSGLHSSYEQFVVLYRQQSVISPCVLSKRSDQTAACQKWSTVIKGMTNFGKTAVGLWTRIGWLTESVLFVYALCTTSKVQIPGLRSDFFFFNNWFFILYSLFVSYLKHWFTGVSQKLSFCGSNASIWTYIVYSHLQIPGAQSKLVGTLITRPGTTFPTFSALHVTTVLYNSDRHTVYQAYQLMCQYLDIWECIVFSQWMGAICDKYIFIPKIIMQINNIPR